VWFHRGFLSRYLWQVVSCTSPMSLGRHVVAGMDLLTPKRAVMLPLAYPPGGMWGGLPTGLNLRVSPHHGLQLLALAVMLAPPLNNAQEFGMSNQKRHEFVTLATLYRLIVMIEGAKHHLD
jgi:hypothetical protein